MLLFVFSILVSIRYQYISNWLRLQKRPIPDYIYVIVISCEFIAPFEQVRQFKEFMCLVGIIIYPKSFHVSSMVIYRLFTLLLIHSMS